MNMNKQQLIDHLNDILEIDLDNVLQGDYDDRNEILDMFEDVINRIENHE